MVVKMVSSDKKCQHFISHDFYPSLGRDQNGDTFTFLNNGIDEIKIKNLKKILITASVLLLMVYRAES